MKSTHKFNSLLLILVALAGSLMLTTQRADAQQRWTANNSMRPASIQTRRLPTVVRSSFVQSSYVTAQTSSYVPTQTASNSTGRRVASSLTPALLRNNLPPVRLDSFVLEAKGHAEHIYGDEGADGLPPYFGFSHPHRINTGINDDRDAGLTTGHGSYMPEAWGADEFIAPPGEWSNSGANGGNFGYNNAAAGLDASAAAQRAAAQSAGSGGSGGLTPEQLAAHPSPGEGYQPMYQHGRFVGWWSPAEIALSQTDFKAALRSIIHSDRFWGDALSIEVEIGDRPMSDIYAALGF